MKTNRLFWQGMHEGRITNIDKNGLITFELFDWYDGNNIITGYRINFTSKPEYLE
jgi:hypothetical protein